MRYLSIRNFDQYQHYKDRRPPWIKLHAAVLDDYNFACLQDASKAHLMLLWVLASKLDNRIPYDLAFLAQRIGATTPIDVEELVLQGFIEVSQEDSAPLAKRQQSAMPETEGETEGEAYKARQSGEAPASLVKNLPSEAKDLLTRFYELPGMTAPQRERYKSVAMQLVDALDPKHPGPKIRGGQRVKARSAEHMADVCRQVMADPPMDRDMAVLFVLKKLTDPPKGPSVTELAKRAEEVTRNEEELYHLEARAAGVQWAKNQPEEYGPILAEVEARYKGKDSSFATLAKASELTSRCAKAAGFPSFEDWRDQNQRRTA